MARRPTGGRLGIIVIGKPRHMATREQPHARERRSWSRSKRGRPYCPKANRLAFGICQAHVDNATLRTEGIRCWPYGGGPIHALTSRETGHR